MSKDNPSIDPSVPKADTQFDQAASLVQAQSLNRAGKRNIGQIPQQKISNYFNDSKKQQIHFSPISLKKADFYAFERFADTTQSIYQGQIQIGSAQKIEQYLQKEKLNQYELKDRQMKMRKQQIMNQLQLLDDQTHKIKNKGNKHQSLHKSRMTDKSISQYENEQNQTDGKLVFSRKQHHQIIKKMIKEREYREKRRKDNLKRMQEKSKEKEELQRKLVQSNKLQEKNKKIIQIQTKLQKMKEHHQAFLNQEKQSQLKYKQLKNKKFLHQSIEERFNLQVKMPLLQQQKKIIKQKRDFAKAYSIDQIKNHQKSYLEIRQNIMRESSLKKSQMALDQQKNYKAPPKSGKLQKILEEQKLNNKKQLMQKKLIIEQKIHRQQNYIEYLKQKFVPKISQSKRQEIRNRVNDSTKRRQIDVDSKVLGINYLEQAKRRRKMTAKSDSEHKDQGEVQNGNITVLSEQNKKNQSANRTSRFTDNPQVREKILMQKKQAKIHNLITDTTLSSKDRIQKLKMETDKINQAFKMKEEMLKYGGNQKMQDQAVELLLLNIQAKIGIMDINK